MRNPRKKVEELKVESQTAKAEFLEADWQMDKYFSEAYGYAIFPNVGKGGFVVGGASGYGIVYQSGAEIGVAKLFASYRWTSGRRDRLIRKLYFSRIKKPWINSKEIILK